MARPSLISRANTVAPQIEKLDRCDESLSLIASDVVELNRELGMLRTEADRLEALLADRESVLAERDRALARLVDDQALAARRIDDSGAALDEAQVRIGEYERDVARLEHELESVRTDLTAGERRLAEAERELARRRSRDGPARPLEPTPYAEPSGATVEPDGHVRFLSSPDGYRLAVSVERCARAGDVIEIDGRRLIVVRVGRSPLPGDVRPCAFLESEPAHT
jgi:chromosome segregation ATPase